ncbi:unnamed protein product [Ceratitis capitata]|uniref:(Mediterranean fruit fly) hypothetical protein n=1 Tax=Ceratitis capitata TaxID=7213 RepID=A0A811UQJ9_CERCA|nr:unnamed protein product [Ceratitis capitata]
MNQKPNNFCVKNEIVNGWKRIKERKKFGYTTAVKTSEGTNERHEEQATTAANFKTHLRHFNKSELLRIEIAKNSSSISSISSEAAATPSGMVSGATLTCQRARSTDEECERLSDELKLRVSQSASQLTNRPTSEPVCDDKVFVMATTL